MAELPATARVPFHAWFTVVPAGSVQVAAHPWIGVAPAVTVTAAWKPPCHELVIVVTARQPLPAGAEDAGTLDGGTDEGGTLDGGTLDGGTDDGGTLDGGTDDGGTLDGGVPGPSVVYVAAVYAAVHLVPHADGSENV